MDKFVINNKTYKLERINSSRNLRAWNAADEYILNYYFENLDKGENNILVLNDSFGALSTPLEGRNKYIINDSLLSNKEIIENHKINNIPTDNLNFIEPTADDVLSKDISVNTVLIRIPKSLDFFKYQLDMLKDYVKEGSIIICGGMTKHLSPHTRETLDEMVGPTDITKTYKKSVIFISKMDKNLLKERSEDQYEILKTDDGSEVFSLPNVFSHNKIDRGTRLLLKNIPSSEENIRIADLGCGNGIVGLTAKKKNERAEIVCVDSSIQAIESAKKTFAMNKIEAEFKLNDGLANFDAESIDLVLSNPPFHADNSVDKNESIRLFDSVKNSLMKDGKFLLVCNKSINYSFHLRKLFQKVRIIDDDGKFYIIETVK